MSPKNRTKAAIAATISFALMFSLAPAATVFAETEESIDFITNVEFIRGHLGQAITNKQAGNVELTIAHAGHPIVEVYALIQGPLAEKNSELESTLESRLEALPDVANSDSVEAFTVKVSEINNLLDQAVQVVAGEEAAEAIVQAGVISGLLETADAEYFEAVEGGEIVEMIEYQDATGFIGRANVAFESIKAELPAHEAEEIEEFFDLLNSGIEARVEPADIAILTEGIMNELEEALDLEGEEEEYDGYAYIDRINELLDQSVAAYKTGNAQSAKALAVEAYLDNYEFIEADIEEDDPELMEKIEVDMRVELAQMIDQGRPASEIESHVQAIKADLETARAVVTPEFPVAIVAIAAVMALAVAMGRFKGLDLFRRSFL